VQYLTSSRIDKKALAERMAEREGIEDGLICVLSCVEPCLSFEVGPNAEKKKLELKHRLRKCLILYHYWMHPVFGFLNASIQTWFPFQIQICLNGREWLARQMDAIGLRYVRQDNCFVWLEDWPRAQQLMDQQLRADWPGLLQGIAHSVNPLHEQLFAKFPLSYYWTVWQSESAIDVGFRDAADLQRLYPRLLQQALTSFGSPDVLRFLGRQRSLTGSGLHGNFAGEVVTTLRPRAEGVRIKHRVEGNSI